MSRWGGALNVAIVPLRKQGEQFASEANAKCRPSSSLSSASASLRRRKQSPFVCECLAAAAFLAEQFFRPFLGPILEEQLPQNTLLCSAAAAAVRETHTHSLKKPCINIWANILLLVVAHLYYYYYIRYTSSSMFKILYYSN